MLATIKSLGYGRRGEEEQQSPVLWPWICKLKEKTNKNKKQNRVVGGVGYPQTLYLQLSDYERVEGVEGAAEKPFTHFV